MRLRILLSLTALALSVTAFGQEGFPLDGTWRGDWGTTPANRTTIVLVMKWDGTNINGMINPGPDSAPFTVAVLNPEDWTVHIEAVDRDDAGNPVTVVIDGQLDDLGSYNRTLEGTWRRGDVEGNFRIARE
ncbi:MAG: hypothetical protein OXQ29_24975 [Rhodospirillaceae bacterium]|nr:hypothetical protein [Rhodospirillaceae bacterium]